MEEDTIRITEINDFIFCPMSIYFHKLYGDFDRVLYQSEKQLEGTAAHETVDNNRYSTSSSYIQGIDVYCEKYNLVGKIDLYDSKKKIIRERKKKIKNIYDGYIFQIYAQYFAMVEMGYEVDALELYSMDDNKIYKIPLPDDNIVIRDKDKVIKCQVSCYTVFMIMIIGDTTLTTGIIRRVKKFNIAICFMSLGFKVYCMLGAEMQGNTLLHRKQYSYNKNDIARYIIRNKIENQIEALKKLRAKTDFVKEAIPMLTEYRELLSNEKLDVREIMGIEGRAAKVYFPRIFNNIKWVGRKPRIKFDYVNTLLDIGYNLLFNFVDAIVQTFGFDEYYGVLHTCFYMRKSLVCDLMEPFRPLIDLQIRKSINLGQFKEEDFVLINNQYQLEYKKSAQYVRIFFEALLDRKEDIFTYIRDYYRSFMKEKCIEEYPVFRLIKNDNN